jgi:endonuclease/exonuclease/phosphatase family metal-dependent hydrolase
VTVAFIPLTRRPFGLNLRIAGTSLPAVGVLALGILVAATMPPGEVRVMSFNIRYGTADDGQNGWTRRMLAVAEVIRGFDPDLLGLQEALRFQLDEIRLALPGYGELGVGRDDGREAGEYAAILFRAERFEPVESGTFWLSDDPSIPGSASWGNRIPRICTWGILRDRSSGVELLVLNAHLDHESASSRERAVALIAARARELRRDLEVVLLGDFNAPPASFPMSWLRGDTGAADSPRLRDAFASAYPDSTDPGTYHGFTGLAAGGRIDAILVSDGWEITAAGVLRTERAGRFPSDHFPVTAVLRPHR